MASNSVTIEIVNSALAGSARERLSAAVLTDSATGKASWRSQVFFIRSRANGFMAMLPASQEVEDSLHAHPVPPGGESVIQSTVSVQLETTRGRALGSGEVILADLPWDYLELFRRAGRSGVRLISFQLGDQLGRPSLESALEVADHWVVSMLDPDTAQEYVTAEEDLDAAPVEEDVRSQSSAPAPSAGDQITALQERIAMLEGLVRDQGGRGQSRHVDVGQKSTLFHGAPIQQSLSPAELERLHRVVGPAPKRLGRTEGAPLAAAEGGDPIQDALMAEADRGVIDLESETQALEQQLMTQVSSSSSDPLQKLMLLQMRQTHHLVRALAPRQQTDPIAAMLSGSDSGSANSGGGISVKGYAAREMFLKQLQDDRKLVEHIKQNARLELGVPEGREEPALLRNFLEQRIPIGDHKSLAQFGYMLAWGWELGETSQNRQLQAFCGRMMMYVEQSCLDSGRSGLAWLMTGLPEPNFQQLALNKKRSTLTPFSKLAPPSWIAANLSYLKDVDTFDTRLRQLGVSRAPAQANSEADGEDRMGKPKFRPKKPKGGKGAKGSEAAPADAPSA